MEDVINSSSTDLLIGSYLGRSKLIVSLCPSNVGPEVSGVGVGRKSHGYEVEGKVGMGNFRCRLPLELERTFRAGMHLVIRTESPPTNS